jgi:hypothetical protein
MCVCVYIYMYVYNICVCVCIVQIHMYDSCIVIHCIGWGCWSPNPHEIHGLNGKFVTDLNDFDLCNIFEKHTLM